MPLSPVLLLAALALAHPDDPTHHHPMATGPAEVHVIVDLALEGALIQRGLDPKLAVRLTAAWTEGILAPVRTRAEGRAAGWTFGETQVRFRAERVADGQLLDDAMGRQSRGSDDTNCTVLHAQPDRPLSLAPMDPRARERGPADTHDSVLDVTWAEGDDANTALVMLQPGESATVVEIVPDAGARPRRRARARRRVEIDTERASLAFVEHEQHAMVCLTMHPVAPVATVVKRPPPEPEPAPEPAPEIPAVEEPASEGELTALADPR